MSDFEVDSFCLQLITRCHFFIARNLLRRYRVLQGIHKHKRYKKMQAIEMAISILCIEVTHVASW